VSVDPRILEAWEEAGNPTRSDLLARVKELDGENDKLKTRIVELEEDSDSRSRHPTPPTRHSP